VRRLALALWFIIALSAGVAQATNIAIGRPVSSASGVQEALFRLQGELAALDLAVRSVELPRDHTSGLVLRTALERLAVDQGLDVIIDVFGDRGPTAVEVWIFERSSQRLRVSRVVLEPDDHNAAETLAIRAIEVLRSNFVEIDLAAKGRGHSAAPPLQDHPVRAPPPRVERLGLEAGVVMLTSAGGMGPALLPLIRFDWAASSRLVAQATVAGFGTRPVLETAVGRARLDQAYALAGLCLCSPAGRGVSPVVSLSAGVLRTSLEGQAASPAEGHVVTQWSFLGEASAGGHLRLSDRYSLTLAFHAQLAQPHVVVHFIDEEVATAGRPNLLVSLTAGAWL
jgi:hypothetical protein